MPVGEASASWSHLQRAGSRTHSTASPRSMPSERGISLPSSFTNVKFDSDGRQLRPPNPFDTERSDAHPLDLLPRSGGSSLERNIPRSLLQPASPTSRAYGSVSAESSFRAVPLAGGSELASRESGLSTQDSIPMPIVPERQQYSIVAGEIPNRTSFLPRTVSVVSITRASSV